MTMNWKTVTDQAHKARCNGHYKEAQMLNRLAVQAATTKFNQVFDSDPEQAVTAVAISYYNLADSWMAVHDFSQALSSLEEARIFFQQELLNTQLSTLQKTTLSRAVNRLKHQYRQFWQQHQKLAVGPSLSPPSTYRSHQD